MKLYFEIGSLDLLYFDICTIILFFQSSISNVQCTWAAAAGEARGVWQRGCATSARERSEWKTLRARRGAAPSGRAPVCGRSVACPLINHYIVICERVNEFIAAGYCVSHQRRLTNTNGAFSLYFRTCYSGQPLVVGTYT
ncbi:hypothetical protein O3G_MSEX012992 [Manduca sexta]|uniref:Uncharacterized protein n=1 Tax=Manduca sexta TaxID=7130 RepID=A0A922CXF8_MANSE|nr:hypothetical protein O3G_MSEX012992 [Manduca sexta]